MDMDEKLKELIYILKNMTPEEDEALQLHYAKHVNEEAVLNLKHALTSVDWRLLTSERLEDVRCTLADTYKEILLEREGRKEKQDGSV